MRKFAIYTLGCKANQYQSFALESEMRDGNSEMRNFGEEADVYIINTCTVTADADRKSRQAIRRALRLAKKVIVTGCYARLQEESLKKLFPEIEILRACPSSPCQGRGGQRVRVRQNLLIEDGCENFCSYCIVPYARGKVTRKPLEDILREATLLVSAGAREIVLTGINLGAWGGLSTVLCSLSTIQNLFRIRLSSLEPQYVTEELIETIASHPKICRHLHLPLQSGDDKILKLMNRQYTAEDYLKLIEKIREKIPNCGITTDVIVGFPNEGEAEFQNTLNLIDRIKFSRLHIFPYSERELTTAAKLPGQVDPKTKKARYAMLNGLRDKYMREFAEKYMGKEIEILVEQRGEGLTSNYIRVKFDDPQDSSGQLYRLTLNDSHIATAT